MRTGDPPFPRQGRHVTGRGLGGEAGNPVVALMDYQEQGRLGSNGARVVSQVSAIRASDLDQTTPGEGDDIRQAKGPANLHHLPARDDYLPSRGKRV